MTTYTHTTKKGHQVEVSCWASNTLNFSVAIGGKHYTDGSSMIGAGDSEESEAKHQAESTAADIESGRLREIHFEWRLIEDHEIERGLKLAEALATTKRDEWEDSGSPEMATEGSTWDFAGWNVVRRHLQLHRWVMLGGDLYALPALQTGFWGTDDCTYYRSGEGHSYLISDPGGDVFGPAPIPFHARLLPLTVLDDGHLKLAEQIESREGQ